MRFSQFKRWVSFILISFLLIQGAVTILAANNPEQTHTKTIVANNKSNQTIPSQMDENNADNQVGNQLKNSPLLFIENVGQFDEQIHFQVRGQQGTFYFANDAVWLTVLEAAPEPRRDCFLGGPHFPLAVLANMGKESCVRSRGVLEPHGANLKLSFTNANPNPRIVGFDPLNTAVSYFIGNNPDNWHTNVPVYAGVRYEDVYPGVDVEYVSLNGHWQAQLVAKPWADLSAVAWQVEGADTPTRQFADGLSLVDDNRLHVETAVGNIEIPLLLIDETKTPIQPKPSLHDNQIRQPFTTTPLTQQTAAGFTPYRTYLGGSTDDIGLDIAVDDSGAAYVVGITWSSDFHPVITNTLQGSTDIFIAKLNPDGSDLVYAAYLGGSGHECSAYSGQCAAAIAIASNGNAYLTGSTWSTDFPTPNGLYTNLGGDVDAFVAQLNAAGNQLLYGTYLGGSQSSWSGADFGHDIAVDSTGYIYVTGETWSSDFPQLNPVKMTPNDETDAFVTKLTPTGDGLIYSTYLGGNIGIEGGGYSYGAYDYGNGIAVDDAGDAYVTGWTASKDLLTGIPAFLQATLGGSSGLDQCREEHWCPDAFVIKLGPGGEAVYGTYLGEPGWDEGRGIAVHNNEAYVTGISGYCAWGWGGCDAPFVTRLNASGSGIIYQTQLNGSQEETSNAIAVDSTGAAYIIGHTNSNDFPVTTDAFQSTLNNHNHDDAFVVKLDESGEQVYGTYLGGSNYDYGYGIAVNASGVYVTGETWSTDFPVSPSALQSNHGGGLRDAFATRFDIPIKTLFFGQDWNAECPFCNVANTQGVEYGINTRTGNFGHMDTALSLPTAGGSLDFRYGYISQATAMYTTTMGFGWVHNHELQLHISDPALTHTVILQAPGGSRFPYTGNGDGTYEKYAGVTAEMVYNSGADEFVVTTFNQYEFTFDGGGQLQEQKDPFGNLTTFNYSGGKLSQATQGNRSLSYFYNGDRLSSVQDDTGRTAVLSYTGDDLTSVTSPLGTMTYQYADGGNLLTGVVDPSGRTVKAVAYDDSGRAYQLRNGNGELLVNITFPQAVAAPQMLALAAEPTSTNLAANVQVVVNGVAMTHVYNSRGVLTDVVYDCTDGTAGCGVGSDTGYDYNFKQTAMQDANGNGTALGWNAGGTNIEFVADALGNGTSLSYDSFNNLTQTVDARGITTTIYYENPAFPTFRTRTVDALGHSQLYTPTVAGVDGAVGGLLKAEQDTSGVVTSYQYNDQGQIIETVRAVDTSAAVTTSYGYDSQGRLITTTQAAIGQSHTTLNVYDSSNHLLATINNWTGSDPAAWAADCDTSAGVRDTNVCTRYGYDAAGRTISTTNTLGQTSLSLYDGAGRSYLSVGNWDGTAYSETTALTDLCDFANPDPEYNLCSLTEYDGVGRVVTTTNSLGIKNVTEYDSLGRVDRTISNWDDGVFVIGEADRDIETRYGYDAVGNTLLVTDTVGSVARTFYDELNRVVGSIDVWSGTTLDECFNADPERDEDICTGYVYDEVGNTIIVTDTMGRMTRTFYDELNRTEATVSNWNPATLSSAEECVVAADNMQDENICTLYGYDALTGNQITTTNALNQTSLTVYDGANRPYLTVQNWDGTPINSEADCQFPPAQSDTNLCSVTYFDVLGRRSSSKNPMGQISEVAYDGLGRVITSTQYLEGVPVSQATGYDALGNRLSSTDAEQHTAGFLYDSLNRLQTTTSAAGVQITQTYNAAGWVITTTNRLGHSVVSGYDNLGRRINVLNAENDLTQYAYDPVGNQQTLIDAEGIRTAYGYDSVNRLTDVIENDKSGDSDHETNVSTWYELDAASNRLEVINGLDVTYSQTSYDDLSRPVVVTDALGIATTTQYNALGYPVVITDGNGAVTTYAYDGLNRVTDVAYLADGETVSTAYNALGQRVSMTDTNGITHYEYDDLNRLTVVTDIFGAVVRYGYDLNGNRTQLVYPDGRTVTYTYDADNRLDTLLAWDGGLTDYDYDEAGRLITTTLPNGVVSVNGYDDADRLTSLRYVADNGELLAEYLYELDGVGNRTVVTETQQLPSTSDQLISFGAGDEQVPATAYSVQNDAYLVVWQVKDEIYGRRITGDGSVIEEPFAIGEGLEPSVAYSSADNAYLVVWQDGANIWGQFVPVTPSIQAFAPFIVYASSIQEPVSQPDVAYSEAANSFLVSWRAASMLGSPRIQATIVKGTGELGGVSTLTSSLYGVSDPAVAAAHNDSFLVVWRDGRNNNDIYGIIFGGKSGAKSIPFAIAQSLSSETAPDVAWNAASGTYLVTWQNNRNLLGNPSDIQGYRVSAYGKLLGSLTTMDNHSNVANPSLTVAADKWLVTWQQGLSNEDIYGRNLLPDGSVGSEIVPLVTSDAAQTIPANVGGNPNGDYLLTWQDDRDGKSAIYSRLFSELSEQTTTTIAYEYDPLYRLTGAVYSGDISASYGYAYDAVGNMAAYTETLTTDSGTETSVVNRAFNDANQLTAATDAVLGTSSYYYDNNGNMTQILPPGVTAGAAGELLYSFTQSNLLKSNRVGMGGGVTTIVATYGYDGGGNRIQQVDHSGGMPITTTYTNDIMGLTQVLAANDGSQSVYSLLGLDLISQDDGTGMRTLLVDGLGSVRQEMAAGAVETTSTYNPYGTLLAQTGTSGTVYGYTGEQEDSATGLVYLRARYYNPALQVFMGKDPWRGDKMRPITQHGYVYGYNSPPNFSDPSGYDPVWCAAEPYGASPEDCYPYNLVEFRGASGENWTASEKWQVNRASAHIGKRLAKTYNQYMYNFGLSEYIPYNLYYLFACGSDKDSFEHPITDREAFIYFYDGQITFYKTGTDPYPTETAYGEWVGNRTVNVYTDIYDRDGKSKIPNTKTGYRWATHELGHGFEYTVNGVIGTTFYVRDHMPDDIANRRGFAGPFNGWQQSDKLTNGEIFADMFIGWNYESWDTTKEFSVDAGAKASFMNRYMPSWIAMVINRHKNKRNAQ